MPRKTVSFVLLRTLAWVGYSLKYIWYLVRLLHFKLTTQPHSPLVRGRSLKGRGGISAIFFWHGFPRSVRFGVTFLALCLVGTLLYLILSESRSASAAPWYDDGWRYRRSIPVTNNTSLQNNVYVSVTLDTSDTGKFQADCGDIRYTKLNGELLPYYIASGCGTATTVTHVLLDVFPAGTQAIYVYYGSPNAANGFSPADFTTAASNYTVGSVAAEEGNDNAPILYWKFDEGYGSVAHDSTPSRNDGSIANGTWSEITPFSTFSQKFNGTTTVISLAYNASSGLDTGTGNLSLSGWFRHGNTTSGTQVLISRYNSGGYKLFMDSTGHICFDIDDDGAWTPDDTTCTTTTYLDSSWHFIEAVKNGTTSITIYIDGSQAAQKTSLVATGSLSGSSPSLYIGADSDGTSNKWSGHLDEIKIFNIARSATQVKSDYSARGSGRGVSTVIAGSDPTSSLTQGLLGYWKMDESSGNAADSSGNGTSLTNNASIAYVGGKYGNSATLNSTSNQYFSTAVTLSGVRSVSFWVYPTDNTNNYLTLTASANITSSGGTLAANGFTGAVIYVNGVASSAIAANAWSLVTITGSGSITADAFTVGKVSTSYYSGRIDEVRVYDHTLSPAEVSRLFEWAPGPVLHWAFEDVTGTTITDYSGNGYTGTWNGTGSHITSGRYGRAGKFNGAAYTDTVTSTAMDNAPFFGQGTIGFWFKIGNSANWNDYNGLFTTYPSGCAPNAENRFVIQKSAAGTGPDILRLWLTTNAGALDGTATNTTFSAASGWVYLVVTWDQPTNMLSMYVNGKLDSKRTDFTYWPSIFPTIKLGNDRDCTGRNFDGAIDDLRIYNYARTTQQIVSDMNGGHPAVGSPVGSAVAHYSFDEGSDNRCTGGTNDVCNKGNEGSAIDGAQSGMAVPATATSGWTHSGKFGKALNFDGSDDLVSIADNNALDITGPASFSFWVKPTDYSGYRGIMSKGWNNCGLSCIVDLYLENSTGYVTLVRANGSSNYIVRSNTAPPTGQWTHVVAVDTGSAYKFYINGKEVGTTVVYGSYVTPTANAENLRIGMRADGATKMYGSLDEIKIYNYALDPGEISLEYNRGSSLAVGTTSTASDGTTPDNSTARQYCPPGNVEGNCANGQNPTPVAEWSFDEKNGTFGRDTSGNDFSATLGGGTAANMPGWTQGKVGPGLRFDGVNDYALVSDQNAFTFASASDLPFTISTWLYIDSSGSGCRTIITKYRSDGILLREWITRLGCYGTTQPDVELWDNTVGGSYSYVGSSDLPTNQWVHFTVAYDGTAGVNSMKMYQNGIPMTVTGTSSGTYVQMRDTITPVKIGTIQNTHSQFFKGKIDQVKMYNYLRTPAQVAWDYNRGGPAVHWRLDECSGTTLNNAAGSGFAASLSVGGTGTQDAPGSCTSGDTGDAWKNGASGKLNASLSFDGTDDYMNVGNLATTINTASLWVKPSSTTQRLVDFDGGTHAFSLNSGTVSAIGFSSPTIYVDGKAGSTISDTNWHLITVTTATGFVVSNMTVGKLGTGYLNGQVDDVRLYTYPMNAMQVNTLFTGGAVNFGP